MNHAAIVIITLLNQGFWFGGQQGEIGVEWTAERGRADAVVQWELNCGLAPLAAGRVALPADPKLVKIRLSPPAVRVVTDAELVYRVKRADNGKLLAEGHAAIHIYPNDLLASLAARLGGKSLAVWDEPDGLPALLKEAKIPFTRIADESGLQLRRYDILVVGVDQLTDRPFAQAKLLGQVESGMSALVLRQSRVKSLAGYPLHQRPAPDKLVWRDRQTVLQHVRARALTVGQESLAIRLPADEPALELVYWPRENPGIQPVPIDALLVAKTLGRGRIVLCQVPLGPWKEDPLAQGLLVDSVDYFAAAPEPTLPPSRRPRTLQVQIRPPQQNQILDPVEPR